MVVCWSMRLRFVVLVMFSVRVVFKVSVGLTVWVGETAELKVKFNPSLNPRE